jgi:hypothetical protein
LKNLEYGFGFVQHDLESFRLGSGVNPYCNCQEDFMRRCAYYKRAAKQFLAGTRFKAPFEAVAAGLKTLEDWADLLALEREIEERYDQERREKRKDRHARREFVPVQATDSQAFL